MCVPSITWQQDSGLAELCTQDTRHHTASAIDSCGLALGSAQFLADAAGYVALPRGLRGFGTLVLAGADCTTGAPGGAEAPSFTRAPIAVTDTKHLVATIRTVRAPHAHAPRTHRSDQQQASSCRLSARRADGYRMPGPAGSPAASRQARRPSPQWRT